MAHDPEKNYATDVVSFIKESKTVHSNSFPTYRTSKITHIPTSPQSGTYEIPIRDLFNANMGKTAFKGYCRAIAFLKGVLLPESSGAAKGCTNQKTWCKIQTPETTSG